MIVYVLKLSQGKYYVGRTENLERRIDEHRFGKGSAWTKMFSVIDVEKTYETDSRFYEDMIVKEMMHEHGIDNVRGGSYPFDISDEEYQFISREIHGANDECFKCGGNHFARRCFRGDKPASREGRKPTRPAYFRQLFLTERSKYMGVLFTEDEIAAAFRDSSVWKSRKSARLAKASALLYNRHIKADNPPGRSATFNEIYSQL